MSFKNKNSSYNSHQRLDNFIKYKKNDVKLAKMFVTLKKKKSYNISIYL